MIYFLKPPNHLTQVMSLGPAHNTPVGDGPLGPSLGLPPKHTVPLGVSSHAIWPVYLNTLRHLAWI